MTATALVFVTATALVFVTATVVVEGTNGMKRDPVIVGTAVELEVSVAVELAISAKTNKQLKETVETVSISRTGVRSQEPQPQETQKVLADGRMFSPDSRRHLRTRTI